MKVTLVFSPPEKAAQLGELGTTLSPPMGVLYLAGFLREHCPHVELSVIDGPRLGFDRTLARIHSEGPDILAVSAYTLTSTGAYALIDRVKADAPETVVIMGGPHVTALPEDALTRAKVDAVAMGEGECTLTEFVRAVEKRGSLDLDDLSDIDGLALRVNGAVVTNKPRALINDLNSIPFPARDLIDLGDYDGFYLTKQKPETIMLFSRGCPFDGTFCSNIIWRNPHTSKPCARIRSPKNIVDEMEQLRVDFGVREVFDQSDEFNNHLKNARAICREMIDRDLHMTWKTQLRCHPLPDDLVKLMHRSGCWYTHLGVESGNPRTLRGTRKHITIEQVESACRTLHRNDIRIHALFMLYNVWEEDNALRFEDTALTRNTLAFARSLAARRLIDYMGWSITEPYPGSPLYEVALKYNLIKPHLQSDWGAWLTENAFVMQLPGVNESDAARLKTEGAKVRALCMLRSGGLNLSTIPYVFKKVVKLVQNELRARFGRTDANRQGGADGL